MTVCRACGKKNQLRRVSRKGLLEKTLLVLLFVRPFRCRFCHTRFYLFTFGRSARSCARPERLKRMVRPSAMQSVGKPPDKIVLETLVQQIHADEVQMQELKDWKGPPVVQKTPASR